MMEEPRRIPNHRKRKRRRRTDKAPVNARLIVDDHVKGDVGLISEDLFRELYAALVHDEENGTLNGVAKDEYLAIAPKAPYDVVQDLSWTVVPVRPSSALASNTIQFSSESLALQQFAEDLARVAPSKLWSMAHNRAGIEILALDIAPLPLDAVFITLEGEQAKRLERGEGTFHGSHPKPIGAANGSTKTTSEDRVSAAVREALSALHIVHTGDLFELPLAPHPITHVAPPPAKVTLCEPVAQGVLQPSTKIIVTATHHRMEKPNKSRTKPINKMLHGVTEMDEDTSNEQFFSAAEDRYKTDAPPETEASASETDSGESDEEQDNLSDDSMEDMISLQTPMLSSSAVSGMSTLQAGTPRLGRGRTGVQTPGSVFSSYTATTARQGGQIGRLFRAQCLMRPLPESLLRPAPPTDDDEENRIYVDVNSLTKIGCFSGDWVRLETAKEPPVNGLGGLWSLGSFGQQDEDEPHWRAVKVYSLPDGYAPKPVTKIPSARDSERRASFFDFQIRRPASAAVYLSPILSANLDHTPYVRLSVLRRQPPLGKLQATRLTSASKPPVARELTFIKIASPLSTERALESAFIAGLKKHLSSRLRFMKEGDLIAVPFDEKLGRTVATTKDDFGVEDGVFAVDEGTSKNTGVVWFKVGHIAASKGEGNDDEEELWGGLAAVSGASTQVVQAGSEQCRLPPTKDSQWEYYLGVRKVPKSATTFAGNNMPELRPQHISTLRRRLRELIAAATSLRAVHLALPPLAILLVSTQRNIGKADIASRACSDIGLHTFVIDAYDIVSEGGAGGDVKTEGFLKARVQRGLDCGPEFCALLIRHIEALTADRMVTALKDILADSRVLIATTTEVDKIPDGVRGLFTHELEMSAPDEAEREGILRSIIDDYGVALAPEIDLSAVAVKTAALVAGDLVDVVDRALVAQRTRLELLAESVAGTDGASVQQLPVTIRDVQLSGGSTGTCLLRSDFEIAVEAARKNFADAIGAPKIPNVSWADVGGLTHVKDAVMETIQLPLERPELFAKGMKKRSGILFYGPPGTGKTLLAKAIATEFSLNFFSVKGPELLNMYIGESEANVRRVFQRARDARPCVVFFDELDSVAPKRGNQGDSGGVMDRIVSQLLAELDGMSDGEDGGGGVFVIGATNRPDLLDAALLRPGRFDKMLYLGVSDTHEKQATIMEALTRKFTLDPSLSLSRIATHLPYTYTGADFYALCSDAMLKAVTRRASAVDAALSAHNASLPTSHPRLTTAAWFDHHATEEDIRVVVTEEDFLEAMRELVPSVSAKELAHYQAVRAQFEAVEDSSDAAAAGGNASGAVATLHAVSKAVPEKDIRTEKRSGVPEWQLASRPRINGSGNGNGNGISNGNGDGNGSSGTATDGIRERERPRSAKGKGKGKAVAVGPASSEDEDGERAGRGGIGHRNGFQVGSVEDDEELY